MEVSQHVTVKGNNLYGRNLSLLVESQWVEHVIILLNWLDPWYSKISVISKKNKYYKNKTMSSLYCYMG